MKSPSESREAAKKFRELWMFSNESEVGGYQKYWISLLADVLGLDDAMGRIRFQIPVPTGKTAKFLDAWIPETKVLIEHKKRGVKLDQPQSGHAANDAAVMKAYGYAPTMTEPEIVADLMRRYQEICKG